MAGIFGTEQREKLEKTILSYPSIDNALSFLEKKTQVKKVYILYAVLACVVSWLMFGWGAQLLCNVIGFVYPAYCSVRALESRSKDDDTKWLTYWVVFALFSVIEFFSDILVGWVPFYWLTKCAFLIWCMSPLDGSSTIYFKIVLPLFKRNQSKVDSFIDRAKEKAGGFTDQMISEAGRIASEAEKKTD